VALAFPHQLSGGMKQRALIATALACAPELLVLDEPTTALDVTIEAQILDLLEKLRRDRGLSMLYITHNLGVVARICDDVCVLYAGRVVEQGATDGRAAPAAPSVYQGAARLAAASRAAPASPGADSRAFPGPAAAAVRLHFPSALQLRAGPLQGASRRYSRTACAAGAPRSWPASAGARTKTRRRARPQRATGAALVDVKDLSKTFQLGGLFDGMRLDWSGGFPLKFEPPKVRAVDGVSLSVWPGKCWAWWVRAAAASPRSAACWSA
jgi:peptide/nickel transport system ATP-binding protein